MKWLLILLLVSSNVLADSVLNVMWNKPTRRVDGALIPLDNIWYYKIWLLEPHKDDDVFVTKPEWEVKPLESSFAIPIENDKPGNWCVKISIVDKLGVESPQSNRICTNIMAGDDNTLPDVSMTFNIIIQQSPQIALEIP